MEIKYYKLTEAAKILTPLAPGATELQMRNYLYSRVGRGVSAKVNKHPITDRKNIKISENELERLKNEFRKKRKM